MGFERGVCASRDYDQSVIGHLADRRFRIEFAPTETFRSAVYKSPSARVRSKVLRVGLEARGKYFSASFVSPLSRARYPSDERACRLL